ncbi:hypothetical protein PWT90_04842 [Aphanocladium album]|nr:hypothetical protein PWT90_04842 [Aphanocladium album]
MKFSNVISLLASGALALAANVDKLAAEAECGPLHVMDAPASAYNTGEVRKCRDHPMGNAPAKRSARPLSDLAASSVEKRCAPLPSETGCGDGGYCWKSCGAKGEWCWTASNFGNGPWARCKTDQQCGSDNQGFGCGGACGC